MAVQWTAYIDAETLRGELAEENNLAIAVELLQTCQIRRVVLEGFRFGAVVAEEWLHAVRDFFERHGFATMGGIMPLHGEAFGKRAEGVETRQPVFCYSDRDTTEALEKEIRKLARLFNQVVIDDGFFTSCRCPECAHACIDGDWGAMRRRLLSDVASRWVRAAHEENRHVRLTVKFPQYYDRYHRFGYDVVRFPKIFDAVWQGTETRDPDTLDYGYVEQYQGYFNLRWMQLCAGAKCESGWFDFLDCNGQLFFDQAVTTSLGAPDAVTIYRYDKTLFNGSRMGRLVKNMDGLEALRAAAEKPQGVHVIKPPNADGGKDLFIFDYLGMLGIPCVPATEISTSMRSIIVTAHGISDRNVVDAIPRALMAGRHVILTFDALRRLADRPEILEFMGYRPSDLAPAGAAVRQFHLDGKTFPCDETFRVPGDLAPSDAAVLAWAELDASAEFPARVPMVTAKSYASGGRAIVWNLGTFGDSDFDIREQLNVPVQTDLFNIPKQVIDFLRQTATGPHRFTIKAPARVATFLFDQHIAFANYGAVPAEVEVSGLAWRSDSLKTDSPKTVCSGSTLFLATRSYGLLELKR